MPGREAVSALQVVRPRGLSDIESDIHEHLDSGRRHLLDAAEDSRRIGELLLEGKELLPHGEFIAWATTKFGFSDRRARQLMARARLSLEEEPISEEVPIQDSTLLLPDTGRINSGMMSSETPEWYTPDHIIERATRTLGGIDLDPCSNSHTNPQVPAKVHYTKADNGLVLPWSGTVYMNPPYGDEIVQWVERLVAEWREGRVTAAVALVPARTDTQWFQNFRDGAICFIRGRLRFSESENSAPFPSAAIYLGHDPTAFMVAFAEIGDTWTRMTIDD